MNMPGPPPYGAPVPPTGVVAPGPVFDVMAVLNGVVDLRAYKRRYLILCSSPPRNFLDNMNASLQGPNIMPLIHLTNGIEFLEAQNFELVNVFTLQSGSWPIYYAMMRRAQGDSAKT